MSAELKPCPFCSSQNAAPYSVKSCHSVLCTACGGEGPEADSEEEAIEAWNRRAASGMQGMEAPSKCDWPVCAVHHPCERKCEREPEKAECRRLWAEEDGRKRAATSPNEGGNAE
jgi:Lar family restriction alleviation protein